MDFSTIVLIWSHWLGNIGLISLLALTLLYFYSSYQFNHWKRKGINGPPALPFIGNFLSPTTPIPLMQIELQKKYGKFYGMYQGRKPVLSISDPVVIKRILVQDFHLFRNRISQPARHKILSQNLVAVRNDKWKRIRSILTPMFTSSKLRKMEGLMTQCVDAMIQALNKLADKNESFLVHGVMGNFTMDVISKCAFATETNAHSEVENMFVRNARSLFNFNLFRSLALFVVPGFMQRWLFSMKVPYIYTKETDFFCDLAFHLIKQRKNNQSQKMEDMLQLMVNAEHGKEEIFEKEDMADAHQVNVGQEEREQEEKIFKDIIGSKYLSEEEIAAQSIVFFLAGYETTASTLTFCLYELAMNPEIQDKLYKEIKTILDSNQGQLVWSEVMKLPYLDAVISETLRKHPPALVLSREASEPYHIPEYNYTLEKDEGIIIPIYSIHHDPEYYKNPEQFNPERFLPENRESLVPYSYLPFGGGPRNCIGMRFALSEAKLGLAQIITNFTINKSNKTCERLEVKKSLFLLKTTPIYVSVKRRQNKN